MALDPPITPDEEQLVVLLRATEAKQRDVDDAEQAAVDSSAQANADRANLRNLRAELAKQFRKHGIVDPEPLMRRQR